MQPPRIAQPPRWPLRPCLPLARPRPARPPRLPRPTGHAGPAQTWTPATPRVALRTARRVGVRAGHPWPQIPDTLPPLGRRRTTERSRGVPTTATAASHGQVLATQPRRRRTARPGRGCGWRRACRPARLGRETTMGTTGQAWGWSGRLKAKRTPRGVGAAWADCGAGSAGLPRPLPPEPTPHGCDLNCAASPTLSLSVAPTRSSGTRTGHRRTRTRGSLGRRRSCASRPALRLCPCMGSGGGSHVARGQSWVPRPGAARSSSVLRRTSRAPRQP